MSGRVYTLLSLPSRKTLEETHSATRTNAHCRGASGARTPCQRRDAESSGAARPVRAHRPCFSSPDAHRPADHLCAGESVPVVAASGPPPSPLPPPLSYSSSSCCCSPPSRRQDGQDTLQSASRDQQKQLFLVRPRELVVEEARQDRVAKPRLQLPGRPGRSKRRSWSCAREQHEFAAAAAGAQEAAGRSAEQIHQPDPRLAEQVSTWREVGVVAGPVSAVLMLSFAPSTLHFYHHVTMRRRKRRRYDEARGGTHTLLGWQTNKNFNDN